MISKFKKFLSAILAVTFFAAIFWLNPNFANAEVELFSDIVLSDDAAYNQKCWEYINSLPQKTNYKSKKPPILIGEALNVETELLIKSLKNPAVYRDMNYTFVAGTYKDYPVVIYRTGENQGNAAASTALAIQKFKPVAVINQGTAGGHIPTLYLNDIVIGEKSFDSTAYITKYQAAGEGIDITTQEMRGVESYDKEVGYFKHYKEYYADSTLLQIAKKVADNHKEFKTIVGTIATGNTWLNGIDHINFIHEKYGSTCEEMETNAVTQICKNADMPFIGIRVISNNITNGVKHNGTSAYTCQKFVLLVVDEYTKTLQK